MQVFYDRDCSPKKHTKKKKHRKERKSLPEFQNTEENQDEAVLQCCKHLEGTKEGDLCTDEEMPSYMQEDTEAEERYKTLLAEAEDDKELSYKIRKKLKKLQIVVPFEVPPSHCIETHFTHVPSEEQKKLLAELGVQLKYKKFTPYEDAIICKNWERFSKEYDFEDITPFLLLESNKLKYSERKHFIQYLGSGLPHRTLYSIYGRFQTLYRPCVKGKFTEVEDDLILHHMSKGMDRNAFSTLSRLFNRERLSVYKRYKWLERERSGGQGRVNWTLQKCEKLVKSLLKVTGSKEVEDLRNKHISMMDWRKVEKDSEIRASCARDIWRYKLSTQLFCPGPVYLKEFRIKLIKRLYRDRIKWWQDIIWADIAKDFGVSPLFLWSLFRKLLKSFYPGKDWEYFRTHFRDTIKDLKRQIHIIKQNPRNYRLQRLRMGEDGNLFVLEEES